MIRNNHGVSVTSAKEIVQVFEQYYTQLYHQEPVPGQLELGRKFLLDLNLPRLSVSEFEALNLPISREEVLEMIKKLPNNKAPGPDGMTTDLYKILQQELVELLLGVYNGMWEGGRIARREKRLL